MDSLVELTSFYPIVEQHGLSKWWLYKQLRKLSTGFKRGVLQSGRCTASFLIPKEEMMHLILRSSKKRSIETIIHRAWTIVYGRRMTYLASRSHGNWQRHYNVPRSSGRIAIAEPEDFFALRPRFNFFIDNKEDLKTVLPKSYYEELFSFLDKVVDRTRKFIAHQSKSRDIQEKLSLLDYESFYESMLDGLLYGESIEVVFKRSLFRSPKRSDKGSSKEHNTRTEGGIERYEGSNSQEMSTPFIMDFTKLKKNFAEAMLTERLVEMRDRRKSRMSKDDEQEALRLAAEDVVILESVIEGLTDEQILNRLELTCTRMTVTSRRQRIMAIAREQFAPLNE